MYRSTIQLPASDASDASDASGAAQRRERCPGGAGVNLRPINPARPRVSLFCVCCGCVTDSDTARADLDGTPGMYYCGACAEAADKARTGVYLSTSGGFWRVISGGLPLCADTTLANSLDVARHFRLTLAPVHWDGDLGAFQVAP